MPEAKFIRPRPQPQPHPAFCEDWDDKTQTTILGSRTTANLAATTSRQGYALAVVDYRHQHDGTDSGYSSKAGTVASEPSGRQKMTELRIDTTIPERERHPYLVSAHARPNVRRESSSRPNGPASEPRTIQNIPYVHPRGICMTCDRYGRHINAEDLPRSSSMAPPTISPMLARRPSGPTSQERAEAEAKAEAKARRLSSKIEQRPQVAYTPTQAQLPYTSNPAMYGWVTPVTPITPYSPIMYSSYTSTTPISFAPTYSSCPTSTNYFGPESKADQRPTKPDRRSSMYGEPIIQHRRESEYVEVEKVVSHKEARPTLTTHRSTRNIEQDRLDMPPPQKPNKRNDDDGSRRPPIKKSATYNTSIVDHRRFQQTADRDVQRRQSSPPPSPRPRQSSPSRPPTSYRAPHALDQTPRPQVSRDAVSYDESNRVGKSSNPGHAVPRRSTVPTTSMEQKEAEAEAYQRERSNMTSEELTTVKLKEMKKNKSGSNHETGSTYSHRSQQSSSKDSSGRTRSHASGHRTSIILDGGVKLDIPSDYVGRDGKPLNIDIGDLSISVGSKDKDSGRKKGQRLLERVPSHASRASRKSVTGSSIISSDKSKDKDVHKSSRRPSQKDDRPPVTTSKRTSRQPSRAPSGARGSIDHDRKQSFSSVRDRDRSDYPDYPDYRA